MTLKRLARGLAGALICVATSTSLTVSADIATLRVSIEGDATLRSSGFDDKVPTWEASSQITVALATSCESAGDEQPVESQSAPDLETGLEVSAD